MFSVRDQENLANAHHTTAAGKPLNQTIRALQPKTPGANHKTPFRPRNDENKPLNTGKAAQNVFATPAPRNRAPLGVKTTNAKAHAFQTPAPLQKANPNEQTARKPSSARQSAKKKIYVAPEETIKADQPVLEDDFEPETGYAPPPIVPLPDPPMDFNYDTTYACLRPENFTRGVGEIYFQSPKDENGFSISQKREQEIHKKSLQKELDKILDTPAAELPSPDEEVKRILAAGPKRAIHTARTKGEVKAVESDLNTIRSRAAASKLSHNTTARTPRLPAAATRETTSSKQKRKPTFEISRDLVAPRSMPPPISKNTIGFPKARQPPSIIPKVEQVQAESVNQTSVGNVQTEQKTVPDESHISPRKFVALYGEPPVESDMWLRLKELEIRDRRREEDSKDASIEHEDSLFELDEDLDDKLAVMFEDDADDFEL